jgi:hypothetical protein
MKFNTKFTAGHGEVHALVAAHPFLEAFQRMMRGLTRFIAMQILVARLAFCASAS